MGTGDDLLRMLEPAVRPVALPSTQQVKPANVPWEQQSFDQLLAKAQPTDDGDDVLSPPQSPTGGSTDPLAALNRIENASLRSLIGPTGADASQPGE